MFAIKTMLPGKISALIGMPEDLFLELLSFVVEYVTDIQDGRYCISDVAKEHISSAMNARNEPTIAIKREFINGALYQHRSMLLMQYYQIILLPSNDNIVNPGMVDLLMDRLCSEAKFIKALSNQLVNPHSVSKLEDEDDDFDDLIDFDEDYTDDMDQASFDMTQNILNTISSNTIKK